MATVKDKKIHRGGCLCCPASEDLLSLDTILYNGFGGYSVYKNNKVFYEGDPSDGVDFESYWKLRKIEKVAQKTKGAWKVVLYTPLRGATWRRRGKNKWVLTETNLGFA